MIQLFYDSETSITSDTTIQSGKADETCGRPSAKPSQVASYNTTAGTFTESRMQTSLHAWGGLARIWHLLVPSPSFPSCDLVWFPPSYPLPFTGKPNALLPFVGLFTGGDCSAVGNDIHLHGEHSRIYNMLNMVQVNVRHFMIGIQIASNNK